MLTRKPDLRRRCCAYGLLTFALAQVVWAWDAYLDDAFIHLRIGEQLFASGQFAFNPGEPGLASSSPLYTAVLGALSSFFGGLTFAPKLLSVFAFFTLLALITRRVLSADRGWPLRLEAASLLVLVSPFAVRWLTDGMETSLVVLTSYLTSGLVAHAPEVVLDISICIPTCNRPLFLRECLLSCIAQTQPATEILVGDDSDDDAATTVVDELSRTTVIPIRHFRHQPALGQAGNVEYLFNKARGDAICLIHDDDLLLERALELLAPCFDDPRVAVAYGKQVPMNHEGRLDEQAGDAFNRQHFRTPECAGAQPDIVIAALSQQFPNNGYLLRADLAREVGYVHPARLTGEDSRGGFAADYGFGIGYAMKSSTRLAYFVDEYTACYRFSKTSVSRGAHGRSESAYRSFRYVTGLEPALRNHPVMREWQRRRAPAAVGQAIDLGHFDEAWAWFLSEAHRPSLLTPGGVKRFLRLVYSSLRRKVLPESRT